MPSLKTVSLAFAVLTVSIAPAAAESYTTRIESRPYYGATVTLEQGVRVWRPLPPTRHMIINPTGAPVNLSVADIRETVTNNNVVRGAPAASASAYAQAPAYGVPVYGRTLGHRGAGVRQYRSGRAAGLRAVR